MRVKHLCILLHLLPPALVKDRVHRLSVCVLLHPPPPLHLGAYIRYGHLGRVYAERSREFAVLENVFFFCKETDENEVPFVWLLALLGLWQKVWCVGGVGVHTSTAEW